jgi:integrase
MTRAEIERQIALGGDSSLWESLYLQLPEIDEFLADMKKRAAHPFVYAMMFTAAYTGARLSELLASQRADFDFDAGVFTVREKKRLRGQTSTRRVPIATKLAEVMREWFEVHPGGPFTFAKPPIAHSRTKKAVGEPLTPSEAHDHFERTTADTKWSVIRRARTNPLGALGRRQLLWSELLRSGPIKESCPLKISLSIGDSVFDRGEDRVIRGPLGNL